MIPLEVSFHHNLDSIHGYVGAALASNIWHWYKKSDRWQVEKVIDVPRDTRFNSRKSLMFLEIQDLIETKVIFGSKVD